MGSEISKLLTDYLPSWTYFVPDVPPVSFEVQDNYDTKGKKTGVVDQEREKLKRRNKRAPWRTSARIFEEIDKARTQQFLRDNEPHMDHPEPKIDMPQASDFIFPGWDATSTTYLRLVFASLDDKNCGQVNRQRIESFIHSLGGSTENEKFKELFKCYDKTGLNIINVDDFLKLTFYLDKNEPDAPPSRIHRKIMKNAEISACLTYMNVNEAIALGLF